MRRFGVRFEVARKESLDDMSGYLSTCGYVTLERQRLLSERASVGLPIITNHDR
jgi:hypothetical protein